MTDFVFNSPKISVSWGPYDTVRMDEFTRIYRELERSSAKIDKMIESRDRVDISLKEYEELKRINKDLLDRLNRAERILGMLDIPADMIQHIDPDSVKTYFAEAFDPKIFVRKRRFRIEFDVEEYD